MRITIDLDTATSGVLMVLTAKEGKPIEEVAADIIRNHIKSGTPEDLARRIRELDTSGVERLIAILDGENEYLLHQKP